MTKSPDTSDWSMDDIDEVKLALPDGVDFASLSSADKSAFSLDLGESISPGLIEKRIEDTEEALEDIGIYAGVPRITAGYNGSKAPRVLLILEIIAVDEP